MKRLSRILLVSMILLGVAFYFYWLLPVWGMPFNAQRHSELPLTPAWALEPWLWEDDVNTAEYVDELLEGYAEHDIPVRTILIDSPWSLRYNDFEVDTVRYPNPEKWFAKLQDDGYRVVLWMTSLVNSDSKDTPIRDSNDWYIMADSLGYLIKTNGTNEWWKGEGGQIDYSNPEAMKWWRGMQQRVFDLDIDGWKLDGAATLMWTKWAGIPFFYGNSSEGLVTTRQYMDWYYREEYKHGLKQNPEFITLTRAIDKKWIHPEGFSPFDASPINWVGDQKHTWGSSGEDNMGAGNDDLVRETDEGIELAIESILQSAELGYSLVGSDIAGFSGGEIPANLYIRWAQFSTFCGLFLNGGHGERRLWKRSQEELEVIRKFTWLHKELIPYMYHYVVMAHSGEKLLQKAMDKGRYQYMFGDDFLIAPICEDSKIREVVLPEGKWRYFFDDKKVIAGGTYKREYPLDEFPVYLKEGAIIPMDIQRNYMQMGDSTSAGFTTILVYPEDKNKFHYYHTDLIGETVISYEEKENSLLLKLEGTKIPHILRIHSTSSPTDVKLDGQIISEGKWQFDEEKLKLIIRIQTYKEGNYEIQF